MHRRLPRPPVFVGIGLAMIGLYLLTGADVHLGRGELFTLACAVLFAFHIVCIGAYVNLLRRCSSDRDAARRGRRCSPSRRRREQGIGSLSTLAVFAVVFTGIACSAVALPLQLWGNSASPRPAPR